MDTMPAQVARLRAKALEYGHTFTPMTEVENGWVISRTGHDPMWHDQLFVYWMRKDDPRGCTSVRVHRPINGRHKNSLAYTSIRKAITLMSFW